MNFVLQHLIVPLLRLQGSVLMQNAPKRSQWRNALGPRKP
jgi:hypothetical protein